MAPLDAATRRLSDLRALPALAERAVRAALRQAITTSQSARGRRSLAARALEVFDASIQSARLEAADKLRVRTEIAAAADRFARSRLAARLTALPLSRVRACANDSPCDLVVTNATGQRFAVCFVRTRDVFQAADVAGRVIASSATLSGAVLYDLATARTRTFAAPALPKCA